MIIGRGVKKLPKKECYSNFPQNSTKKFDDIKNYDIVTITRCSLFVNNIERFLNNLKVLINNNKIVLIDFVSKHQRIDNVYKYALVNSDGNQIILNYHNNICPVTMVTDIRSFDNCFVDETINVAEQIILSYDMIMDAGLKLEHIKIAINDIDDKNNDTYIVGQLINAS